MEQNSNAIPRKSFIGTFAAGATILGLSSAFSSCDNKEKPAAAAAAAASTEKKDPADEWFDKLDGKKHSVVYDVTEPHEIFPFAWSRVFLMTNEQTGTKAADSGVVVVLRHAGICYAMPNSMWEKYPLGEVMKAEDPKTKKPATRNPD